MDQPLPGARIITATLATIVLVGLGVAYFAGIYFYAHTQTAIELTPQHPDNMQNCIYIGLLLALGCAILIWFLTAGAAALRIVLTGLALVLGFAAALQVSIAVTNVHQMRADFPADKTLSYMDQWPITGAYRVHSRKSGTSYWIRTPTLNAPLDINGQDFEFVRTNATPEDISTDGTQILSHGRFCANVNLQRAGEAIRLMVGPGRPLPAGSIGLCSQSPGN